MAGGIRTIVPQKGSSKHLFVGTVKNMILEGSVGKKFNPLIIGHAKQLWALAIHPKLPVFATAGYDRNILRWKSHRPEWRVQVRTNIILVGNFIVMLRLKETSMASTIKTDHNSLTIRSLQY